MSVLFKTHSLKTALAQASIYRRLRYYGAAKQILTPFLEHYPQHAALQALYQQIQQQLVQGPARQRHRLLPQLSTERTPLCTK